MGKAQKKTGKGRLDKYYKLAKEQGYRARSAFKLIQLNKKYSILESSRCTIDLCAAPGGWLQVASKYMPANSVIVGVDLVPIRPIPRVVTFTSDITTTQCRNLIRNELKDWKADVVLHDGAPNVGTAWIQDAYSQSELVLMSLKLAVEFLAKGGTFVTKVFRSVDYNNLIWVFNQLFGKVEATKPPSSRNVSAEIFVVCREFLAPKHIDPKFLDPKHVFKDLSSSINPEDKGVSMDKAQANVFHPEKKRRHRDGYADGDYTLFKILEASTFIREHDPIAALGGANKISFHSEEEKEWLALHITTEEVKANCEDLKVLGKGDFKALIKWRLALREELGIDLKAKDIEDAIEQVEVVEVVDEEQEISEELERLNAEAAARTKRERRRANEIKTRTIQRMQLQMTAPLDIGLEQSDPTLGLGQDDMFELGTKEEDLRKSRKTKLAMDADGDEDFGESSDEDMESGEEDSPLDSEEERERKVADLETEMDGMYEAYQERMRERDAKYKVKEARRKNKEREEWGGIKAKGSNDDSGAEDGEGFDNGEDGGWDKLQEAKLRDSDSSDDDGSDEEVGPTASEKKKRTREEKGIDVGPKAKKRLKVSFDEPSAKPATSAAAKVWFSQDVFGGLKLDEVDDEGEDTEDEGALSEESEIEADEDSETSETDEDSGFEVVPQDNNDDDVDMWDGDEEDQSERVQKRVRDFGLNTPEAVMIAQQLINREKTKTQLINDGFNRYSLNSKDDLPSWFLDDEAKFYKPNIPVTKEAMAALRAKQRALDARPIKKVAEAKARKKFKAAQRLEKAMKKAEGVNTTADMSEKEKAQAIDKVMRKGLSSGKKPKKDIKLVVAKGAHKGLKGRPKGVKGRYVMVDSRMKKELKAKKRKEKAAKKR
ncbi:Spb1 C-terminal domain-containing protein [Crepidotus variabilis]|uniref:Spb1 C-terminal domain-containing protein n=1 Tax=Crepidotus variabilis TaxID=179855 RepID=A0A9P6EN42_9AGAR|nr:Spb1 C-terminal domain-containing protein [Crepidotus variabilis]